MKDKQSAKISIDFGKIRGPRALRTKRAKTLLQRTAKKHFRNTNLKISQLLNNELWRYGLEGVRKTTVAFLLKENHLWAHLPSEKPESFLPKPKEKKEEKTKKEEKPKNTKQEQEKEQQKETQKKVIETEKKLQASKKK